MAFQPNSEHTVRVTIRSTGNTLQDAHIQLQIVPGGNVGEKSIGSIQPGSTVDTTIQLTMPSSPGTAELRIDLFSRPTGMTDWTRAAGFPRAVGAVEIAVPVQVGVELISAEWV